MVKFSEFKKQSVLFALLLPLLCRIYTVIERGDFNARL